METDSILTRKPKYLIKEATAFINSELRDGKPAYKLLPLIRAYPRPIVTDFNGLITNNTDPMSLNPGASFFINELRQIGNVFVVTTAPNWDSVHEFLDESGVWFPDMLLLTAPNFRFLSHNPESSQGIKLRNQFLDFANKNKFNIEKKDLLGSLRHKRLGPLFLKPFNVPIIDDEAIAVTNNPGMLGIQVQNWEPNFPDSLKWQPDKNNKGKATLREAFELVKDFYSSIGPSITEEAIR